MRRLRQAYNKMDLVPVRAKWLFSKEGLDIRIVFHWREDGKGFKSSITGECIKGDGGLGAEIYETELRGRQIARNLKI